MHLFTISLKTYNQTQSFRNGKFRIKNYLLRITTINKYNIVDLV